MKKIIILLALIAVTGCSMLDVSNTPTKKVEEFLNKYQILDEEVLNQLDDVIESKTKLNNENKEELRLAQEEEKTFSNRIKIFFHGDKEFKKKYDDIFEVNMIPFFDNTIILFFYLFVNPLTKKLVKIYYRQMFIFIIKFLCFFQSLIIFS